MAVPKIHLTKTNIATALLVPILMTGLFAWALFTPGNDPANLFAGGGVIVFTWCLAVGYLWSCLSYWKDFIHFYTPTCNIAVGWRLSSYAVSPAEAEAEVQRAVNALSPKYGKLSCMAALQFCIIEYAAPAFVADGRWVAGLQDNNYCTVGWSETLSKGATAHELGHRIIQIHEPGLSEAQEHSILASVGL